MSKIISNLEKYTQQRVPPEEQLEETVSVKIQPPDEKRKAATPIWMAIGFAMTVVVAISVSIYLLVMLGSLQQRMNVDKAVINQLNIQIMQLGNNLQDRAEAVNLLNKRATRQAVIIGALEGQILSLSGRVADGRAELEMLKLTLSSQSAARAQMFEELVEPATTEGI